MKFKGIKEACSLTKSYCRKDGRGEWVAIWREGEQVYTKVILYIDKENGLPYYKYGLGKTNGQVLIDGVSFEVTDFSAEPTYEGLIMSLDGLTEAQ